MTANSSSSIGNKSKKAFEKLRTTEEEEEEGESQHSLDHPQDDHNHNGEDLDDPPEPHSLRHDSNKRSRDLPYQPILPWSVISKLNWDILFLLGGGFALSYGFQVKLSFLV